MTGQPAAIEELFAPSLSHDPSARPLIPALLAAAPGARARLGELADHPGSLSLTLSVRGVSGRLGCFEYPVATARELLAWQIDHPERLTDAGDPGATQETRRLREFLLNDDPPGSRARAQDRAHDLLATANPYGSAWWRFEEAAAPECVLMTDQLVVTVQSDERDPLAPASPWFPARTRFVRDLEAARRLADGRPYGSLLIADRFGDPQLGDAEVLRLIADGTPHLDAAARAELAGGYLGRISWEAARSAVAGSATT